MRTLIASLTTAIGLALLTAVAANAGMIPAMPKNDLPKTDWALPGNGAVEQVHWRHHRRNYAYYPRYRYYDDYSYSYPRYRSYGYYGAPGFSLYIGPRHGWGHHRRW